MSRLLVRCEAEIPLLFSFHNSKFLLTIQNSSRLPSQIGLWVLSTVESLIPVKVLSLQSLTKCLNLIGIMKELVWELQTNFNKTEVLLGYDVSINYLIAFLLKACCQNYVSRRHQNTCSLSKQQSTFLGLLGHVQRSYFLHSKKHKETDLDLPIKVMHRSILPNSLQKQI